MKHRWTAWIAALDSRWPGWASLTVAALTLLALALRVHELARWDLTFDEAASIWIARKPPPQMIGYLLGAFHEHPPFYYLSLWAWTQVAGDGEFALRFLSVGCGVLSVSLIYVWLTRLIGRGAGLIGAFLLALSPFHIYYSQDARMYTLVGALALLSLIFFGKILNDGRRRWWAAWGAITLIGLSTHYFMGLVNAAETVFLAVSFRRHGRALKAWLVLHAGVAVVIGLWLLASPGLQTTLGNMLVEEGRIEPLIRTLRILSFDVIFSPVSRLSHAWLWAMLVAAAAGLATAIVSRRNPARAQAGWLVGALILVPPFLVLLTPESLAARYILYVLFGYLGALALALTWVGRRFPLLALGLTLVVAGASVSRYEHQFPTPKSVYGQVIDTVRSNWQPGDALILNGPWQWVQLAYYWPGDVPMFWLPPQTPPPLDPATAAPVLESIAKDFRRAWVIQTAVPLADPDAFVVRWLNERTFLAERGANWMLYYTRHAERMSRAQPVGVIVEDMLELREAAVAAGEVEAGDAVLVDLHWWVKRAPGVDLVASLALADPNGTIWTERVYQPGAMFAPPETWIDGQEIVDRQALRIPRETLPGDYTLRVNVRRAESGSALMPPGADGDPWITVASVHIVTPGLPRR